LPDAAVNLRPARSDLAATMSRKRVRTTSNASALIVIESFRRIGVLEGRPAGNLHQFPCRRPIAFPERSCRVVHEFRFSGDCADVARWRH
jgi:hypothetical protein